MEEVKITEAHSTTCTYNPQKSLNMKGKFGFDLKCPRCQQLLDRVEQRREQ